jgi:hypothetical protein
MLPIHVMFISDAETSFWGNLQSQFQTRTRMRRVRLGGIYQRLAGDQMDLHKRFRLRWQVVMRTECGNAATVVIYRTMSHAVLTLSSALGSASASGRPSHASAPL